MGSWLDASVLFWAFKLDATRKRAQIRRKIKGRDRLDSTPKLSPVVFLPGRFRNARGNEYSSRFGCVYGRIACIICNPIGVTRRYPGASRPTCDECKKKFLPKAFLSGDGKADALSETKHICPECMLAKQVASFLLALSVLWVLKGVLGVFLHHWGIFHEWPDDQLQRFSLYCWPYNMQIPVVVLWGMCWMFAIYDENPYQLWEPDGFNWNTFMSEEQILSDLFPSAVNHSSQPPEALGVTDCDELRVSFGQPATLTLAHKSSSLVTPQDAVTNDYPLQEEATQGGEPTVYAPSPSNGTSMPTQINSATATAPSVSGTSSIAQPGELPRAPVNPVPPITPATATPMRPPAPRINLPKKHKCQQDGCGMTFAHIREFDAHVAERHGKGRYKCEVCNEPFNRSDNMIKHVEYKHPDDWQDTQVGKRAIRKRAAKAAKMAGEIRQLSTPLEGSASGGGTSSVQVAAPSPAYVARLVTENEILRAENKRLWKLVDSLTTAGTGGRCRHNTDDHDELFNAGRSKGYRKRRKRE